MRITGSALKVRRENLGLSQAKLAELTGVPQQALSAFELENAPLLPIYLKSVAEALNDNARLKELTKRKKRYQAHSYSAVAHDPKRIALYKQTKENIKYVQLLEQLNEARDIAPSSKYTALSLFSGCGGFSLGFSWAGFQIKGFLELDPELRSIYRNNFPSALELGSDITEVSDDDLKIIASKVGKIDALIGGPPCQGFSLSGKRQVNDPRNGLFRHYLRFVDAIKPRIAIMENVRVLTSMKSPHGTYVKDEISAQFLAHGYKVLFFEVNAKDYGVPQHRERVFFIAVRNDCGIAPSLPPPTHRGTDNLLNKELPPYRSFADACSDLPYLESGEKSHDILHEAVCHPNHVINWLWDVPQGSSAHDNLDISKRPPSGYNTTYKRQIWLEPASTVQTTFGMISGCRNVHPIATRSLTIREAARIQSFPDKFKFEGSLGTIRTGIGNAVPPLMAYSLGVHIRQHILELIKISGL